MALTQTLLGLAVSGGCAAAAALANHCITRFQVNRLLPRISRIYGLLDPLFAEMSGNWSGSDLRFGCEILVALLADGRLSDGEIRWAADEVIKRFNPIKGADGARRFLAPEGPDRQVIAQVRLAVERKTFAAAGAAAAARSIRSVLKGEL